MPESFLVVVICVAFFAFYFWSRRYLKGKVVEANKEEAYKQTKAVLAGYTYPIAGAGMIGIVLVNLNGIPQENRVIAYVLVAVGVALIFYGVYVVLRNRSRQ